MPERQQGSNASEWNSVQLLLQNYVRQEQISAAELSRRLGLSPVYVWRILQGQRRASTPRVISAVEELTGRPVQFGSGDLSWRRADAQLDLGVQAFHAGDLLGAEVHFSQVHETAGGSTLERFVGAKAKFWHAGIIRDRNVLRDDRARGVRGAISMYREVADVWADLAPELVPETAFMLGACDEMQSRNDTALATYRRLRTDVAEGLRDVRLLARIGARTGALETKINLIDAAEESLGVALSRAATLEDAVPYSFAQEKLAILRMRQGRLDEAWNALETATKSIPTPSALKTIQSLCVRANLEAKEGLTDAASKTLSEAATLCELGGYAHQRHYVSQRIKQLMNSG